MGTRSRTLVWRATKSVQLATATFSAVMLLAPHQMSHATSDYPARIVFAIGADNSHFYSAAHMTTTSELDARPVYSSLHDQGDIADRRCIGQFYRPAALWKAHVNCSHESAVWGDKSRFQLPANTGAILIETLQIATQRKINDRQQQAQAEPRISVEQIRTKLIYIESPPESFDPCSELLSIYADFIDPRPIGNCGSQAYYSESTRQVVYTISYDDEMSMNHSTSWYIPPLEYILPISRPICGKFLALRFSRPGANPFVIIADSIVKSPVIVPDGRKLVPTERCLVIGKSHPDQ